MVEIFFIFGLATFPFINVRPVLGLSISDLFLTLSFLLLIGKAVIHKKTIDKGTIFHPFILPTFFILLGGLLASLNGLNPQDSLQVLIKVIFVFGLLPVPILVIINEKTVEKVLNAIIIGITFSSVIAIIDSVFGSSIGLAFAINPEFTLDYGGAGRYGGVALHPNFQGNYIAVCLPIITEFLFKYHKKAWAFGRYLIIFILCAYALILTGSISSLLAAIIGLSIVFLTRQANSTKRRVFTTIGIESLLAVGLISVISGTYENIYYKALSLAKSNPNLSRVINFTYSSRMNANVYALREITKHPFVGVGFDDGSLEMYAPLDLLGNPSGVHNPILRAWLAGGILALLGYIIMYFSALRTSLNVILKYLKGITRPWLIGLSGAVITFLIFDMAQPSTHMRITWIIYFILYALSSKQKSGYQLDP